jgi:hypothetical protein
MKKEMRQISLENEVFVGFNFLTSGAFKRPLFINKYRYATLQNKCADFIGYKIIKT